jgi:hypothetical protein
VVSGTSDGGAAVPPVQGLRRARVASLATYVPPRLLTNADLEKLVDTTSEWILQRTGIHTRHVVDPGVATSDHAKAAALQGSRLDDYYGRLSTASAPARLAALEGSRLDDYYGRLTNASTAATAAELQDLAKRWAPFYAGLDKALKDAGARP